jgi:hypothetical protein
VKALIAGFLQPEDAVNIAVVGTVRHPEVTGRPDAALV